MQIVDLFYAFPLRFATSRCRIDCSTPLREGKIAMLVLGLELVELDSDASRIKHVRLLVREKTEEKKETKESCTPRFWVNLH